MRTHPRPWTDEEYGFLQDTMDRPAQEVADALGRTKATIYTIRYQMRNGWSPKREGSRGWTADEDRFMLANRNMAPADVAMHLERTEDAVLNRQQTLRKRHGGLSFGGNISPFKPGSRPLVAMTCPDCGYLLQANWFQADAKGWCRSCKRCRGSRRVRPVDRHANRKIGRGYAVRQALTMPTAHRQGEPWTAQDLLILENPDLTIMEKALKLQRTYAGTVTAAARYGCKSKVGLGDPERDQWFIDNPNANEYAV